MSEQSKPEQYKFEGNLSGQLQGPYDVERTELPISIQFEEDGACLELHDPKGSRESLKVQVEPEVAHQLFRIIETFSR